MGTRDYRIEKSHIVPTELQPIVITGLGVLSSIGLGREAFWSALRAGKSGIRAV